METIHGAIKKIIFHNRDTGFKVIKARLPSGPIVTITGEFGPEIANGTVAYFHGDYKTHAKYGTHFRSSSVEILHNAEELSSIKLFIEAIAPNIGTERAHMIVSHFEGDTIDILDNHPERLIEVEGIGAISAQSLAEAWKENRERWQTERQDYTLRAFLTSLGVKERRIKKILRHFGGGLNAEISIRENPYLLTQIEGFGFTTADYIARQLGIPENSPLRLTAYILYSINVLCPANGHLFLTIEELISFINKFIRDTNTKFIDKSVFVPSDITEFIQELVAKKILVKDSDALYSKYLHDIETQSAAKICAIMNEETDRIFLNKEEIDHFISGYEDENKITLSEEQKKALYYFTEKKVYVITGAPGTGKCLGYGTEILMYDGTIKMVQDVIAGDQLMGDDSTPRLVLDTCSGRDQMYRVETISGDSYVVNESHILSLKMTEKPHLTFDMSLKDYLTLDEPMKKQLKGYRTAVEFNESELPVDPYALGYWLGNGDNSVIYIPYPEIFHYLLKQIIPENSSFESKNKKYFGMNYSFLTTLRQLDLLGNKHIPHIYKINSRKNRLKLIAGLIDSVGVLNKERTYILTLKNYNLTKDIVFLVRSLGFSVTFNIIKKENSETFSKIVIGSKDIFNIPCKVPRKKPIYLKRKNTLWSRITVTPLGMGAYYGFEISGNGRFVLGDFTVTHNTSILKAVVGLITHLKLNLTCMAPTGISAKKMSSTILFDAHTIHRRLGYRGTEWVYNEINKFETDVIIIDESSMIEMEVFYRLLMAIKNNVQLIFVGDNNQLPSVGAGNVLKELISCGQIPVIKLDHIFRQDEASDIIKAAHKIKNGDTDLDLFKSSPQADIFFLRVYDTDIIQDFIVKLAQKFKNERRIFQIITPRNTGPLSVENLNNSLQATLNPSGVEKERILKNFLIRRGDRVIIIKNDYELGVFNGEIGKITFIGNDKLVIELEEKTIEIGIEEASEKIKLAYTLSVHRCIDPDSFIATPSGYQKMFNLQENEKVHVSNNCSEKIIWHGTTGVKKLIRITTEKGYTINASEDHQFLVAFDTEAYVKAKDLTLGTHLCLNRDILPGAPVSLQNTKISGIDYPDHPDTFSILTEDISWLLGFLSENSLYSEEEIKLQCPDHIKKIDYFRNILHSLGIHFFPSYERDPSTIELENYDYWLEETLKGKISEDNKIPEFIFKASVLCKLSFIAGLLDAKGSVDDMGRISYLTKDSAIAHSLQILLLSCGIISLSKSIDNDFVVTMNFYPYKNFLKDKSRKQNLKDYPFENEETIPYGEKTIKKYLHLMHSFSTNDLPSKKLTFSFLKTLIHYLKIQDKDIPEEFLTISNNHYYYDRIISLELTHIVSETQDMEIENMHKYIANGFVCHNSQGQEYPYIILPFINQFGRNMLQRNLLYTAITRAQKKVIVIGHGSAIEKAINNSSAHKRNTKLGERICYRNMKKSSLPISPGELADYPTAQNNEEPH